MAEFANFTIAMTTSIQRQPFTIKQALLAILLLCAGLAFPEFSFFAPLAIAFLLVLMGIVAIVYCVAFVFDHSTQALRVAAKNNFLALTLVLMGLLAYTYYGSYFIDWDLG